MKLGVVKGVSTSTSFESSCATGTQVKTNDKAASWQTKDNEPLTKTVTLTYSQLIPCITIQIGGTFLCEAPAWGLIKSEYSSYVILLRVFGMFNTNLPA